MSRFFGKLGFIHRRLWRNDARYRAALLFGPAPLLGCLLALGLWEGSVAVGNLTYRPPAWAARQGSNTWNTTSDKPQMVRPDKPLPPTGSDGALTGYQTGFQVTANPMEVNSQMAVDVKSPPVSGFSLSGPTFDMEQIIGHGPQNLLYAAVGTSFFAPRISGIYALSARFERSAGPQADCLIRLGFGGHRIVSTLEVGVVQDVSKTFDPARFQLEPGLYRIAWAFACWHDHALVGTGRMVLLVAHPEDPTPLPARPEDIMRPQQTSR